MNLNKVLIVGRVTANPELRKTPSGQSVSTFSVATNRVYMDKNNTRQEETEFHNIVVWGRQAEIASQFMTKGSLTLVEGRLKTRSWQDKQGSTHRATEIICDRFQLGPRPQGATAPAGNWGTPGHNTGQKFGGSSPVAASPSEQVTPEEIPIINVDDMGAGEIKGEEIPF